MLALGGTHGNLKVAYIGADHAESVEQTLQSSTGMGERFCEAHGDLARAEGNLSKTSIVV